MCVSKSFFTSNEFSFLVKYLDFLRNSRLKNLERPLHGIDDPRNGLLLCNILHPIVGKSLAAFLPVIVAHLIGFQVY